MRYSKDQLLMMLPIVQTFFLEAEREWVKKNPKQREPVEALMTEAWHTTFQLAQAGIDLDYNWVPGEDEKKAPEDMQRGFEEMFEKVPPPKTNRNYERKNIERMFREEETIDGWTHLLLEDSNGTLKKVAGKTVGDFFLEAASFQIGRWNGFCFMGQDRITPIFTCNALSLPGIKSVLESQFRKRLQGMVKGL